MRYRRSDIGGATYFFTLNLANRDQCLLTDHIEALRQIVRLVKRRHPFRIDAMVVLPDHLHAIWTLPEGDSDYPTRWGLIKGGFSRQIPHTEQRRASRIAKGERGIWQRRYWEHLIRDEPDYSQHVDYVHYNPVKHGHVKRASDWPYSSMHRYIRLGLMTADWGASNAADHLEFGER